MPVPFIKMHGLGNDFVIIDARDGGFDTKADVIRVIADRNRGVGCDQLIVLEPARQNSADFYMAIYNADGSRVGACGNATRCVTRLILEKEPQGAAARTLTIETQSGILKAEKTPEGFYAVDMGLAQLDWRAIPMAHEINTLAVDTGKTGLPPAVAVGMGNPHAVFFMQNVEGIDLAGIGPQIENHPLFPERTNVEFAEILDAGHIRMRVWERGSGITQACGSGACATLVAAVRRGLIGRKAQVILDGGPLLIEWLENGHVLMSGPAALSFSGTLSDELLGAA